MVYAVACIACVPFALVALAAGMCFIAAASRPSTTLGHEPASHELWIGLGTYGLGLLIGVLSCRLNRMAVPAFDDVRAHVALQKPHLRELAEPLMVGASLVGYIIGPGMIIVFSILVSLQVYWLVAGR